MALNNLYFPEPIPDPFDAGEPARRRVPSPRREMDPAMASDCQPEVDRPAKIKNRVVLSAQAASSACERSARISCSCSIPIDSRT